MGLCCGRPVTNKKIRYSDVKDSLQTGDLVLFHGTGWSSFWVRWATCSPISHVGIVVRCAHFQTDPEEVGKTELYLLHSNADSPNVVDMFSGDLKSGVQLNPLKETLRSYDGHVYLRQLYDPLSVEAQERLCDKDFHGWMEEVAQCPYTEDWSELFLATYDGPGGENVNHSYSFFCSKLVREAYKMIGYMRGDDNSAEYVPNDFASWSLDMLDTYCLKDEVELDFGMRVRKRDISNEKRSA